MIGEVATLHEPFMAWLKKHGYPYIRARSDKKSWIAEGHPDFTVLRNGLCALVEFKKSPNRLSGIQEERIAELESAGFKVCVAYDLQTAIDHIQQILPVPVLAESQADEAREKQDGTEPEAITTPSDSSRRAKPYLRTVDGFGPLVCWIENGKEVARPATAEEKLRLKNKI